MKIKEASLLLFLILLLSVITTLLPAKTLSITEAKKIALKNNLDYLTKKAELKQKEISVSKAYTGCLPKVNASSSLTYYTPEIETGAGMDIKEYSTDISLSVSQPIFQGGQITNAVKTSKLQLEIQKNDVSKSKREIGKEVEMKYYDLLEKKRLVEFSKDQKIKSEENEKSSKIKYDAGVITKAELLQAETDNAETEVNLLNAKNNYQIIMLEFLNFLKIDEEIELNSVNITEYTYLINFFTNFSSNEISLLYHKLKKFAIDNNLDIKNSSIRTSISETSLDNAKGKFLPQVSLGYSYNLSKSNIDDEFSGQGNLQLKASIPIFPIYDNYLSLKNSKLDIKKTSYSNDLNKDRVMLGIKKDLYNLITSIKTFQASVISREASEKSYEQTKILFDNGSTDLINLLNSKVIYANAENSYISNFYKILRNLQDLTYDTGFNNEKELIGVIFEK